MQRMNRLMIAVLFLIALTGWGTRTADAQQSLIVEVTVQLRDATGQPLTGESLTLATFLTDVNATMRCQTDADGRCRWAVEPGLYELLSARPLDAVSRLALAEGGLRGYGLTVGETPITYHFVLHSDTRLHFDAAPEAVQPQPIIPVADPDHTHGIAVPTEPPIPPATASAEPTDARATPEETPWAIATTTRQTSTTGSQLSRILTVIGYIGLGLAVGGGLHWWTRRRAGGRKEPNDA